MSQYEKWLRCFMRWLVEALEANDTKLAFELARTIELMKRRNKID